MKHLKKLAVAAMTVAALTALVGVSSASADMQFHASAGAGVTLTGNQTVSHKFTVKGSSVTCTTAKFKGKSAAATASTQEMEPEYTGCTAFGIAGATITTTGCVYTFHAEQQISREKHRNRNKDVDLSGCTAGGITILSTNAFGTCEVFVKNQTMINGNEFENEGTSPNRRLIVKTKATNIHFEVKKDTGICPLNTSPATETNGSLRVKGRRQSPRLPARLAGIAV